MAIEVERSGVCEFSEERFIVELAMMFFGWKFFGGFCGGSGGGEVELGVRSSAGVEFGGVLLLVFPAIDGE